ncbi:hypothetical protein QCA50_012814 [Cerrena zonata]|uniref:Uncharacterized protein n=1 Tax=Cerrena zonata TaxID=2478898 RepID=A0AAW0G2M5_9APHY
MQAGIFAMSASQAWNGKVTTSAWVLHGTEISKKDFDGSLIRPGHFNYKVQKEYLPPSQLVMGFAFYWLGDEDTTEKYKQIRTNKESEHGLQIIMDNKKRDLEEVIAKSKAEHLEADQESETVETKPETLSVSESATEPVESATEPVESASEPVTESESKEGSAEPETGKKRMSAKERRLLRKGKTNSKNEEDDIVDPIQEEMNKLKVQEQEEKKNESNNQQQPPKVRGKKAKLKKIANKYAAQDEEERRLRMDALGTLKQVEAKEKKQQEDVETEKNQQLEKKYQSEAALRKKKQEEREYQKYIMEEVNEDESSVTNYLEILDSFLVKPQPQDATIAPIPVFAPWSSLNKFKYKVKIQPGMGKKGKAVNEALHYFTHRKMDPNGQDTDLDWSNEREMLNSIKTNDLMSVFTVSKLKLMLPGGSAGKDNGPHEDSFWSCGSIDTPSAYCIVRWVHVTRDPMNKQLLVQNQGIASEHRHYGGDGPKNYIKTLTEALD